MSQTWIGWAINYWYNLRIDKRRELLSGRRKWNLPNFNCYRWNTMFFVQQNEHCILQSDSSCCAHLSTCHKLDSEQACIESKASTQLDPLWEKQYMRMLTAFFQKTQYMSMRACNIHTHIYNLLLVMEPWAFLYTYYFIPPLSQGRATACSLPLIYCKAMSCFLCWNCKKGKYITSTKNLKPRNQSPFYVIR